MGNIPKKVDISDLSTFSSDDVVQCLKKELVSLDGRKLFQRLDIATIEAKASKSLVGLINLGFNQSDTNKIAHLFRKRDEFMRQNLLHWTCEKLTNWMMQNCSAVALKIVKQERYTPCFLAEFNTVKELVSVLDFPSTDALKLYELVQQIKRGDFRRKRPSLFLIDTNINRDLLHTPDRYSLLYSDCQTPESKLLASVTPSESLMPDSPSMACPLTPPPHNSTRSSESIFLDAGGDFLPSSPSQKRRLPEEFKCSFRFASVFISQPTIFQEVANVERAMLMPPDIEYYFKETQASLVLAFEKHNLHLNENTTHMICVYAMSSHHAVFYFLQIQTNALQNMIKDATGKSFSKIEIRNSFRKNGWNFLQTFNIFCRQNTL